MEENLKRDLRQSKYKIFLIILKIIPIVLTIISLVNTILYYLGIECVWLSLTGGVSFITILFLWIASNVFQFCVYHKIFIYYLLFEYTVSVIDYTIGIPITLMQFLIFDSIIVGVLLCIILYFYLHNKNANNNKENTTWISR